MSDEPITSAAPETVVQIDGAPAPRAHTAGDLARTLFARYGVLIAFGLMILAFSLARPNTFPTWANAQSILTAAAPGMIVALGLTVVLAMQDFDLSIGSMVGLADGAAVAAMTQYGVGLAGRRRARARARRRRRPHDRLPRRRARRQLVHHDARDGDDPDRGRVRLHGPGGRLPGGRARVRAHRRELVARDQQPGLDRPGGRARALDPARCDRDRPLHVRDRRQPGSGAAVRDPRRARSASPAS